MNLKTTWALFGGFFGVIIVMLLVSLFGGHKSSAGKGYLLPSFRDQAKADDIGVVTVERFRDKDGKTASAKLVFERTEQGWRLKQPSTRVQNSMVEQILDQLRNAQRSETSDPLPNDLAKFGLKEPAAVVTLQHKSGEREWTVNLGNQSIGDESKAVVYANSSDQAQPLPIPRLRINSLFKSMKEYLPLELLNAGALNTSQVSLQDAKGKLALEKGSDSKWRYLEPAYGEADYEGEPAPATAPAPAGKTITGVKELLESIGALRLESDSDFVQFDASDADLAKHGVDSKPATLRIDVKRTSDSLLGGGDARKEPVTEVLFIGKKVTAPSGGRKPPEGDDKEKKAETKDDKDDKDKKADKFYARLDGERTIVQISATSVEPILKVVNTPALLRNRDLAELDPAKTDAIDVQSGGLFKLRRAGTPSTWKVFRPDTEVKEAYSPAVDDLIKALNVKRQIKEFPADKSDADLGFDKPAVVLSAWVDGIKKEDTKDDVDKKHEKSDDKKDKKDAKDAPSGSRKPESEPKLKQQIPSVTLTFGKKDKDLVYVKREVGKDKTVVAVPATLLDKVNQGPLSYLDRILPSFIVSDAVHLEIERAGKDSNYVFVVEKDAKTGGWLLKEPKELSGKSADAAKVGDMLSELARLHTDKLVAEKPGDLDKLGLKPAQVQATVTLKDKKKLTYLFGKEADDKSGLYARQGERDLVFLVKPAELEAVLRGSLEDLTVFRFVADKVVDLKITGWRKAGKEAEVLHISRRLGQAWQVKSPAKDYEVDPLAVSGFLSRLASLNAQKIVVRKKGPEPGQQLADKERALHIEITVEGVAMPLTLSLGNLDAKVMAYFAQSSTLPGDVFLLPQKPFDEILKSGPKYFQKRVEGK